MQHPSFLLLLLICFFLPADGLLGKCSSGQSCLQVKSCSDLPQPPFTRCAFHPTRVCCHHKKKMERLMQQKPLDPGKCGLSFGKPSLEGLLVGGEEAERGKWPWMVSILSQKKKKAGPICTGFLIDQRHVLTAAHCFRSTDPGHYSVRLGDRGKEVRVSRVLLHPSYRPKWFHDDVALLTLALDLPRAHPVCLPANPLIASKSATVLGWGATRTSGPMSERLRELGGLPVMGAAECERSLREHLHHHFGAILPRGLDDSLLCAGAPHKDTCNGDSGGPLMVQEGGQWFAVGVVAFGTSKCAVGVPGVYTNVAHYVPWIQQNKEK